MKRRHNQSGAVLAEFLIALFPFLYLFLGVMQLALISVAKVSVAYAASCAARAAVVVIPAKAEGSSNLSGSADPIKDAAVYALAPIAPSLPERDTVGNALDGRGGEAKTPIKVAAAERATGVIVTQADANAWDAQITTRVVHLYRCQVPLVNRFFCSSFPDLSADAKRDLEQAKVGSLGAGRYLVLRAESTLTKQGRRRN
jgi:hypothetical protein